MTREKLIKEYVLPACRNTWNDKICKEIEKALEQEPKTGHWIKIVVNSQHKIKCDKCDYIEPEYITHIRNYCPNCGARMVKPQESEDKE